MLYFLKTMECSSFLGNYLYFYLFIEHFIIYGVVMLGRKTPRLLEWSDYKVQCGAFLVQLSRSTMVKMVKLAGR